MSIATAIQNAQTKVAAAYTSCNNKGATMPAAANQNLSNLSTTIDSIQTQIPINRTIQLWVKTEEGGVVTYSREQLVNTTDYTAINDTQFQNDTSLVSVMLPDTVYRLGNNSFNGCTNLRYVNLENITVYGDRSLLNSGLTGELYLPKITGNELGTSTFQGTKITSIASLGTLTQLMGNPSVSRAPFGFCTELESVTLPSSLTTLYCAFWGCTKLKTINLENVTTLRAWTFRDCYNLRINELYLPNLTTLEDNAFGPNRNGNSFPYIYKITSLGHITQIPDGNPGSNYGVFSQFTGLNEVTLHEGITKIGACAFYQCTSLLSITLPSTVTTINQWALSDCTSMTTLTCLATTPPTCNSPYFPNTLTAIYVPAASVSAYQSASYWSSFASKIQAIP